MRKLLLAAVGVAFLALPATAQNVTTWTIDPAHSAAHFAVRHMMVSTVRGEFSKVSGEVLIDEDDTTRSSAQINIDAASLNTNEERRDNHVKSADFLDVANYPTMTFVSKRVERAGAGGLRLTGDLTIRGVTKEVTFEVDGPTDPISAGRGGRKRGASATTTINRKDFGVAWNRALETGGVLVSDEVKITIDLELSEKRNPQPSSKENALSPIQGSRESAALVPPNSALMICRT